MANIQIPTHYSATQARLVSEALELLIDTLIDVHTALIGQYHQAFDEPDEWIPEDFDLEADPSEDIPY
jgi:hypothetical protein